MIQSFEKAITVKQMFEKLKLLVETESDTILVTEDYEAGIRPLKYFELGTIFQIRKPNISSYGVSFFEDDERRNNEELHKKYKDYMRAIQL